MNILSIFGGGFFLGYLNIFRVFEYFDYLWGFFFWGLKYLNILIISGSILWLWILDYLWGEYFEGLPWPTLITAAKTLISFRQNFIICGILSFRFERNLWEDYFPGHTCERFSRRRWFSPKALALPGSCGIRLKSNISFNNKNQRNSSFITKNKYKTPSTKTTKTHHHLVRGCVLRDPLVCWSFLDVEAITLTVQ